MFKKIDTNKVEKKEKRANKTNESSNVFDVPLLARVIANIITSIGAICSILPLLLAFSISITDESALKTYGFSLIPRQIGFQGYEYILRHSEKILTSYGITFFVTVAGTVMGLLLMTMYSYVISRKSFPLRKQFTFIPLFTMLFSGGMLGAYIINTNVLHLQDKIWALIFPMCMSGMYVLILKTFMTTSVPDSVVESAKIDGASEFTCYYKIVIPMAVPAIATIALFLAVSYWNDWQQGFLYILSNTKIIPIQLFLKRIEDDLQLLTSNTGGLTSSEMADLIKNLPSLSVRMALVVIVVVPILVTYPLFQRFFVQGITIGAVKE